MDSLTGTLSDLAAKAAALFAEEQSLMPMYIHLIISAVLPIYAGAHASLSRPSSAADPPKKGEKGKTDDEDEEEDNDVQKMEGLSNSDAIILPITAGLVLAGLYFLITRYGADMINLIMGWYFAGVGMFSVAKLTSDIVTLLLTFVFPAYYAAGNKLWKIDSLQRKAIAVEAATAEERTSPLPGFWSKLPLPSWTKGLLWSTRRTFKSTYVVKAYIATLLEFRGKLTAINMAAAMLGVANAIYVTFVDRPWFLTNLQGFAVSYCALQLLSPTSFATGSLILSALFFYDIWAVFFTPLMVTVAKNLDQPIKLVFPRPDEPGKTPDAPPVKSFSMLGLGDIVIPGIVIGLALRFDLYMFYLKKQKKLDDASKTKDKSVEKAKYISPKGHWGDRLWTWGLPASSLPVSLTGGFPKPYFTAAMTGYVLSMIGTVVSMSIFRTPQPALLYLVPGVLSFLWSTGLLRGEIGEMWRYSEALTGDPLPEGQTEDEQKKKEKTSEGQPENEEKKKDEASSPQVGFFRSLWIELFGGDSEQKEEKDATSEKEKEDKKTTKDDPKKQKESEYPEDLLVSFSITLHNPKSQNTKHDSPEEPRAKSLSRDNI